MPIGRRAGVITSSRVTEVNGEVGYSGRLRARTDAAPAASTIENHRWELTAVEPRWARFSPPDNSLKLTRRAGSKVLLARPAVRAHNLGELPASAGQLSSRPLGSETMSRLKCCPRESA